MDARLLRLAALVPALVLLSARSSPGASFSTANFVVTTGDANFARQCAQTAEKFRAQLAREWLGHELPRWFRPCQVSVTVGQIGAGGATTFTFAAGQVFGWDMRVQGTPERILDSVIPHEVSHTVFASYFRRPLPRWADEGAASLVEHESERRRQSLLLQQVFNTPQRIPLTSLISMKEYPGDMQSVLTLYAEGYSLADYLVQSGGERGKNAISASCKTRTSTIGITRSARGTGCPISRRSSAAGATGSPRAARKSPNPTTARSPKPTLKPCGSGASSSARKARTTRLPPSASRKPTRSPPKPTRTIEATIDRLRRPSLTEPAETRLRRQRPQPETVARGTAGRSAVGRPSPRRTRADDQ